MAMRIKPSSGASRDPAAAQVSVGAVASPGAVRARPRGARPRAGRDPRIGSSRFGYTFRRILAAGDLAALAVAGFATLGLAELAGRGGVDAGTVALFACFLPVWMLIAYGAGLYHLAERRVDHSFADELAPVALATTIWAWLFVVAKSALLSAPAELWGPTVLWLTVIGLVPAFRSTARGVAQRHAWYRRPVVVIGDPASTEPVLRRIARHPEWGLDPVGAIDHAPGSRLRLDRLDGAAGGESANGAGGEPETWREAADLAAALVAMEVDRAIVTGGAAGDLDARTDLVLELSQHQIAVDYVSGGPESLYSTAVLHHLEGLAVLSVRPTMPGRASRALKRGVDIAGAALGLAATAPILALAAIRIKLDSPGPVLFRQARAGLDGRRFEMLKLRTMVDGADDLRPELRERAGDGERPALLKLDRDPRITRVGHGLRRWSIDELPQLWNVLRGDMSLVGPRPLPLDEAGMVTDHFVARTQMRPGITGPWQALGRSEIPFEDMVWLDYTYVMGWSLREDVRLLLRTLAAVTRRDGAY